MFTSISTIFLCLTCHIGVLDSAGSSADRQYPADANLTWATDIFKNLIPSDAMGSTSQPSRPEEATGHTTENAEAPERIDDNVALSFSAFWYRVFGMGVSARAGYYINPDLMVEGMILGGASILPNFHKAKNISVGLRSFFKGDHYVKYALAYREYMTDDWISDAVEALLESSFNQPENVDRYIEGRDLGLDVALGSRWQWGFFALDMDWVGLYLPIYTLEVEAVIEDDEINQVVFRETLSDSDGSTQMDTRFFNLNFVFSF